MPEGSRSELLEDVIKKVKDGTIADVDLGLWLWPTEGLIEDMACLPTTPLFVAVRDLDVEAVEMLLNTGLYKPENYEEAYASLHQIFMSWLSRERIATIREEEFNAVQGIMTILLKNGADFSRIFRSYARIEQGYLAYDAYIRHETGYNEVPLDLAAVNNRNRLYQLFVNNGWAFVDVLKIMDILWDDLMKALDQESPLKLSEVEEQKIDNIGSTVPNKISQAAAKGFSTQKMLALMSYGKAMTEIVRATQERDLTPSRVNIIGLINVLGSIDEAIKYYYFYHFDHRISPKLRYVAPTLIENLYGDPKNKGYKNLIKTLTKLGVSSASCNAALDLLGSEATLDKIWHLALRIGNQASDINLSILSFLSFEEQILALAHHALGKRNNKIHRTTLEEFLSKRLLAPQAKEFEIVTPEGFEPVPGDGLCFYHAIARLLGGDMDGHALYRMAMHDILANHERYRGFYADDFFEYQLGRQNPWGDHLMGLALANALGREIEVRMFDLAGNEIAEPNIIRPIVAHDLLPLRIANLGNFHYVPQRVALAEPAESAEAAAAVEEPVANTHNETPAELDGAVLPGLDELHITVAGAYSCLPTE